MKFYEITYSYEGKQYSTVEQPIKGWEDDFLQQVLNCIESITRAGGAVINVVGHGKRKGDMKVTLWDKFMNADFDGRTWRIYEKGTRKLLCADYGGLKNDDTHLDDRTFVKADLKVNKYGFEYWRIVVE